MQPSVLGRWSTGSCQCYRARLKLVLVLGEKKLGIKRNSRVSKGVGLLGAWGFFALFFFPTWFIFLLCFIAQPHTQLYRHSWGAASCDASAGTGRTWRYTAARPILSLGKTCCVTAPSVCLFCGSSVCFPRHFGSHAPSCRFYLCIFKLNHEQKGCTLPSTCDCALSVVLLLLALKTWWLFPHSASSVYEVCDWPCWCKVCLCFVHEDIRHHWLCLLCIKVTGRKDEQWCG